VTQRRRRFAETGPARQRVVVRVWLLRRPGSFCEPDPNPFYWLHPRTSVLRPQLGPPYPSSSHTATMSHTGTMRGTPKNRNNAQSQAPPFVNSPSAIPRPAFETHASQSDAGTSTMSASRQKMAKRDEVRCGSIRAAYDPPNKSHRLSAARLIRISARSRSPEAVYANRKRPLPALSSP
jgi:hypothetical protein